VAIYENPRQFLTDAALPMAEALRAEDIIHPDARPAEAPSQRARRYLAARGHRDSVHHVIWSPAGRTALSIGDAFFVLHPHQVALVPALTPHEEYSANASRSQFVWLLVAADGATFVSHGAAHWAMQLPHPEAINGRVERLIEEVRLADEFHPAYFNAELRNVLIDVRRALSAEEPTSQRNWYGSVCRAMEHYIERHISEPDLSLAQVARHVRLCQSYASSLYRLHTGNTLWFYLTKARVRSAKHLLLEPRLNVAEVAERLGFRSARYFRKVFKTATGLSPRQYRHQGEANTQK